MNGGFSYKGVGLGGGFSSGKGGSTTNQQSGTSATNSALGRSSSLTDSRNQRSATETSNTQSASFTGTTSNSNSLTSGSTLSSTYAGGQGYSAVYSSLAGNSEVGPVHTHRRMCLDQVVSESLVVAPCSTSCRCA